MTCSLHPKYHFKQQQLERGVSTEEVRKAVFQGQRTRDGDGKVHGAWGVWEVVFREQPCNIVLITVYLRDR